MRVTTRSGLVEGVITPGILAECAAPGNRPSADWGVRSISSFRLTAGSNIDATNVRGYYIDLREKAARPDWPPSWMPYPGYHRYIGLGQFGLGSYERFLAGEGPQWLATAVSAAEMMVADQAVQGAHDGGWPEPEDYRHTFRMRGPWLSAMAQGHCASLLVRVHRETGRPEFADAARRATRPYRVPSGQGGVQANLDGRPFPEEYPTEPASFILNGGLYALWGLHDVAVGLGDSEARHLYDEMLDTFVANIDRWDLGYWSRYDLYPHPGVSNAASVSYHLLHINQLRVTNMLTPRHELLDAADRFERYASRRLDRLRGLGHKVVFRLAVPRNERIARRLPWSHAAHG